MPPSGAAASIRAMLKTTTAARLLASAAALTAVLAPAAAEAKRATFSVELEAHRTVTWNHPRVEMGGSCSGRNYMEGRGSEDFKLKSKADGRLLVEGTGRRVTSVEFGTEGDRRRLLQSEDPTAKGVITRTRRWVTGRTGGWCGGAEQDPIKPGDCGTRLVPFSYRLALEQGVVRFTETRGFATNERYGFYDCRLDTPEGVPADSLPRLEQKLPVPLHKLFDKRQRTIVIDAAKEYGPSIRKLANGADHTASASFTWKVTLKRVANLEPRAENG